MNHVLADLVSSAFDVPIWAPRAVRRVAGLVIIGTVLLAPDAFRAGMESWIKVQTQSLMESINPLLHPEVPAHTSDVEAPTVAP